MNKEDYLLDINNSIRDALSKLNELSGKSSTIFVVDQNKVVGAITDGDIRRNLLLDAVLEDSVEKVMNKNFFKVYHKKFTYNDYLSAKKKGIEVLPLLNDTNHLVRVLHLNDMKSLLPVHAVIMAGGKGSRLMPLTKNKPKPLLEVGGEAIIQRNVNRLHQFGIDHISITLNYLGKQIENHFSSFDKPIDFDFVYEGMEPLGTLGSIKLANIQFDDVLVMNSDLLTNIDFEDMYRQFLESGAEMAVAAIPYFVDIPYAVLETQEDDITSFEEKPRYTYYSNAGIYFIKKKLLEEIPHKEFFNATDLIEKLLREKRKVVKYVITGYWLDIGKHNDFEKAQQDINHINF